MPYLLASYAVGGVSVRLLLRPGYRNRRLAREVGIWESAVQTAFPWTPALTSEGTEVADLDSAGYREWWRVVALTHDKDDTGERTLVFVVS